MARLPDEVVERIKREISVQRLAEARGIQLRRSGKELIGLCPFHKDTNPSLNIDPVKNVWQCKGACGKSGSVIDWVMLAEGISVRHALELLCRDYLPSATNATEPPPRKSTTVKLPPLIEHTAKEIYTHVAIRKLQQIHGATHPGAKLEHKKSAVTNDAPRPERRREGCTAGRARSGN
jgi:DNA primase